MHLTSTNSSPPRPSQDIPVIIARLGIKRKFLSRMETYDDMRWVVRRKFNIDENAELTFEVSDFDVCNNERVEVDETAYPAMAPYMNELYVNVIAPESEMSLGSSKGKARELYPTPTPNTSGDSVVRDQDDDQHIPSLPKRSLSSPKAQVESAPASNTYPEGDEEDEDENQDILSSEAKPPSLPSPNKPTSTTKVPFITPTTTTPPPISRSKSRSIGPSVATTNHNADKLFNDSVVVDDVIIADPPVERERELFGPQFCNGKETDQEKGGKRQKQNQSHEIIDVDLEELPKYEEAGPSSRSPIITLDPYTQNVEEEERKPVSKTKRAGTSRLTKLDDVDDTQKSTTASKLLFKKPATISRQNSVKAHDETEPPAGTQGPVLHEPHEGQENDDDNDLIQPDGRFKICISGPHLDHRAEFMTKSRHVLRKVLLGACKTFKLDPKRSHLEQLVVVPEGELYFQCNNSDTVGKAGLRPGSALRVVVDDEVEEDN